MGQRASCCCWPPVGSNNSLPLSAPIQLPAPPAALLTTAPTRRLWRRSRSTTQLTAFVRSSPLSARLPPAVLIAVYQRALHLYHLSPDRLAWTQYRAPSATATAASTATPTDSSAAVYYCSLHTAETTWQPPPHYTPLTAADYHIQPTIDWFPTLIALAASLQLSISFHNDSTPLTDSYYQQLITAASPSLPSLLYVLPLLSSVLASYPSSFYRLLALECVVVCERLHYKGVEWRCVPVLTAGRLYVSCERVDAVYLQSTLHHELFHFIDHSILTIQAASPTTTATASRLRNHVARPDPEWCALNVPTFMYGGGGMAVRDATASSAVSSPCAGLLNAYAASAVEEDKAEVWAALMRDEAAVSGGGDEIVRRKAALLRGRVERWSEGSLGVQWWRGVSARAFSHEARQRKGVNEARHSPRRACR